MFVQWDDSVRRGYRLHITNLEDRAYTYTVRYWVTPPNEEGGWAATLNQLFYIFDSDVYSPAQSGWPPQFLRSGNVYVAAQTFEVEPKQTVTAGIMLGTSSRPSSDIKFPSVAEGYVTLEVPVLRSKQDSPFRPFPQAMGPIKVLLNPETTMIHTDRQGQGYTSTLQGVTTGFVSRTHLDFDTVEPLVPASGKAENEITPNGVIPLGRDALVEAVKTSHVIEGRPVTSDLPVAGQMSALIELLCGLDAHKEFVDELNEVLLKNGAQVRISRGRQ